MDSDPTPGDPEEVRELAESLQTFADDVGEALGRVRGMADDRAVLEWAGRSAEAFRSEFDGVPGNLEKLRTSYDLAARALGTYWPKLETAQGMADRALDRAIAAQADLTSAQGALSDAEGWVDRAAAESTRLQEEGERDGVEPPDEAEVRAATRDRAAADQAASSARGRVDEAGGRLDAARQLAREAQGLREEAARECAREIDEASDAGIQNRSWWDNLVRWFSDAWDTLVAICKVVVAVLGVIALIIGGPLALIVLAAAVVVLADTLVKYANGEGSLLDVAFAALDCIPGMRGLTTLGGLARGIRSLATTGLHGLRQGLRGLGRSIRRFGRGGDTLVCRTDPVDMATGELVMDATDVELPGVLPLVLRRHHRSGLREGTWFGPSWASTLDQRLLLDAGGVRLVTEDGMVLDYPRPIPDEPMLPVEGPRWALTWSGAADTPIAVHRRDSGHTLHFAPVPGRSGAELPLVALGDRNGNRIRIGYDPSGAPRDIVHDGGYHIGVSTSHHRITELRLLNDPEAPTLLRYGYDERGNLAEIRDSSGQPQRLRYDERHRLAGWEDRNGSWYRYEYDTEGRCVATEGADGFLGSAIAYDAEACRTRFTDSLGHTTVYEFNDSYQLVAETDPLGHTTHRTWDRHDRLTSLTDPLGHTTRLEWSVHGDLTRVRLPNATESSASFTDLGLPYELTDHDGAVWLQEWDERGNCVRLTDPEGAVTRYGYDTFGALTELTDALGAVWHFGNNRAGQPTSAVDPLGATTRYGYDAFGNAATVTDPLGGITRVTWTVEGLPASRTEPDGATESWAYDGEGNCLTHTDPLGQVTRVAYTHFDRIAARTTPDGAHHAYRYDTELRLTGVTDPRGLTWEYGYDAAGRPTTETDFDGHVTHSAHDPLGRLLRRVNALGQTVEFVYDAAGFRIAKTVDGATTDFASDPAGRLVRAAGPDAVLTVGYDLLGRVTSEAVEGRVLATAYDAVGRPIRRTTPTGAVTDYAYDPAGRRTALTAAGRTLASRHDAAGQEISRRLGAAGALLGLTHDAAGRLTRQSLTAPGGSEPAWRRGYEYRPDGLPTALDQPAGGRRTFTLDGAGRVTGVDARGWRESYAYDAAGNPTRADWPDRHPAVEARGERAYTGNRLTRAGGVRYSFDAAGRVVLRRRTRLSRKPEVWRYAWDAEDRLTAVTTPDGTRWRYHYDPLGRRIAKQRLAADGTTVVEETRFTWDGPHLVEQTTVVVGEPGETTLTWERDGTVPLAQRERRRVSAEAPQDVVDQRFFAIVSDLIGTPTELVDEAGETVWRAEATLWGLTRGRPGDATADTATATADTPLRFPGQYFDPETELHYNYFRLYDPAVARYLSPDPLGLDGGPNPHSYVVNPLLWLDYLGLLSCGDHAKLLRRYMTLEGRGPLPGHAAAHIVPSGFNRGGAPQMRALLARYRIHVNDAANGISLGHPRPHNFTHHNAYFQRLGTHLGDLVADRVARGFGQRAIRRALRGELRHVGSQILDELRRGKPSSTAYWTAP
ncbi:DUF6531 domain-containing protein [Streptomyces hainanensis]|nr:DUF6531 domain-containing protein [Streptomyces hainanensis]